MLKNQPTVTTNAGPSVPLGSSLHDTATLANASSTATGTITFRLYGPNDATCSGAPISTSTATVNGNGNYVSADFTPTAAGTYRWVANYGGDAANEATTNGCNGTNENVVVNPAGPAVTTNAGSDVTLGATLHDTATLSGGQNPTGTITFRLYGPNDATCSGAPVSTSTATVNGNGNYVSADFVPTAAGTYRWVANYGGDANNNATTNGCNAANENVVVRPASPTVTTNAGADVTLGSALRDTATLSGGQSPTGTITFRLYGPNDATCSGAAVSTSTATVSGNGNYQSGAFTPTAPGTYRWVANYGGDANNNATTNGCNGTNENVVVTGNAAIQIVKTGPGSALAGSDVPFTLEVTNPGNLALSNVTISDARCNATPPTLQSKHGDGTPATLDPGDNWTYTCSSHTAFSDGSLHNEATATGTPPSGPPVNDTDDADVPLRHPDISIDKTGPASVTAGATINYNLDVKNTGDQRFAQSKVVLTDPMCDATPVLASKNGDTTPAFLNPGETWTYTCSHATTAATRGTIHNVGNVTGTDEAGDVVTDSDTADTVVNAGPTNPAIHIVKSGPASALAGSDVGFTLAVTNPGDQPLSNVSITDSRCNATPPTLTSKNGDASPNTLDPGDTWNYTCSSHTSVAEGTLHNEASTTGTPPSGPPVTDTDTFDVPLRHPDISIDKNGPASVTAGTTINYTLDVKNTGDQRFAEAKVELTDPMCNATPVLSTKNGDNTPAFLDPGETWTYTCSRATTSGQTGTVHNVGNVTGTDEAGDVVTDSDPADTTLNPPPPPGCTVNCGPAPNPAISINKTGPATGIAGNPIPYILDVTNTGDQPFAEGNLALTDALCGATPVLSSKNGDQSPAKLNPGETWTYTCTVPTALGQTFIHNVGNVTGVPDNGPPVSSTDAADTTLSQPAQEVQPLLPGVSRLRGPTGCISARSHVLRVTGSRIARVSFYLDGRYVGTRTKANSGSAYTFTVRGAKLRRGAHRVVARVTYRADTNPATRTLTLAFARCARAVTPKFTG